MLTKRLRDTYLIYGTLLALALYTVTDPDLGLISNMTYGGETLALVVLTIKAVIYLSLLHWSRKALFDYPCGDFEALGDMSIKTPVSAAIYAVAIAIMSLAISIIISAVIIVSNGNTG